MAAPVYRSKEYAACDANSAVLFVPASSDGLDPGDDVPVADYV